MRGPRRTAEEFLARAKELRILAATATTQDVIDALLRLADRYEEAARVQ